MNAVRASQVHISQKLQIIIVWAVFIVFVMSRPLFCRFPGDKKTLKFVWCYFLLFSQISHMLHAHYNEISPALDIFLFFIWIFFSFLAPYECLYLYHAHLSPLRRLEWFIHISNLVSWWNLNNVRVSLGWLAGPTWIQSEPTYLHPCLSFAPLFYPGITQTYFDEVLQKINRPWLT